MILYFLLYVRPVHRRRFWLSDKLVDMASKALPDRLILEKSLIIGVSLYHSIIMAIATSWCAHFYVLSWDLFILENHWFWYTQLIEFKRIIVYFCLFCRLWRRSGWASGLPVFDAICNFDRLNRIPVDIFLRYVDRLLNFLINGPLLAFVYGTISLRLNICENRVLVDLSWSETFRLAILTSDFRL